MSDSSSLPVVRKSILASLEKILPCLFSDPPILPNGYKGRDVALRHSFVDADFSDPSQYLLGRSDNDPDESPLSGLNALKETVELRRVRNPSELFKTLSFRMSHNGLEAAAIWYIWEGLEAGLAIILERAPAADMSSTVTQSAGTPGIRQPVTTEWRYAHLLPADVLDSSWSKTPAQAVQKWQKTVGGGADGDGDDNMENGGARTDAITTAEEFWGGVSDDDDEEEVPAAGAGPSTGALKMQRDERERAERYLEQFSGKWDPPRGFRTKTLDDADDAVAEALAEATEAHGPAAKAARQKALAEIYRKIQREADEKAAAEAAAEAAAAARAETVRAATRAQSQAAPRAPAARPAEPATRAARAFPQTGDQETVTDTALSAALEAAWRLYILSPRGQAAATRADLRARFLRLAEEASQWPSPS